MLIRACMLNGSNTVYFKCFDKNNSAFLLMYYLYHEVH